MPLYPIQGTNTDGAQPVVPHAISSAGVAIAASANNPIPIYDGYQPPVSATWTSATTLNSTLAVTIPGYETVMVSLVGTAPVTGGHVTFEFYDGAAWLPIKVFAMESYNSYQGVTLSGALNNAWQVDLAGAQQFRVRLDTAVVGAGSVKVALALTSAPSVAGTTVGLDPTVANLVASGASSALNLTAATLVKATAGRLVRINVLVAGTVAGSANDAATVVAAVAANQIFSIPNTVGSYLLDWPCTAGIVVTPGTGQTVAVSYT